MYKCTYDFWDESKFPGFKKSLSDLYDRSMDEYLSRFDLQNKKRDLLCLKTVFPLIEYYYAVLIKLGYVNQKNFFNILRQLKSIESVNILKTNSIRGATVGDKIAINPVLKQRNDLSEQDMFKLTVFHELGHIINNAWLEDMEAFCDRLFNNAVVRLKLNKYGIMSKFDLINGFILLDDVMVEEAAEDILYRSLKMPRPSFLSIKSDDFPGIIYRSNFNTYALFQEVGLNFFRCFNFIDCAQEKKVNAALRRSVISSFSSDFIRKMEAEVCTEITKMEDFALMLGCLGKIKNANYASFGVGVYSSRQNNSYYYNLFQSLVSNKIIKADDDDKKQGYNN